MSDQNEKLVESRPKQVTVRFTEEDIMRVRAVKGTLALQVHVSDAEIVHQLALMGLVAFERKQYKTRKA